MFTLAQPACYSSYNPYEEFLLQQELQRRRQVGAYLRRQREVEELERRRQFEHAIRQAEVERRRQAEYERRRAEVERRRQEAELQRRRDAERRRYSMLDASVQDLFDMIYDGDARLRSRSMSPRASPARAQSEDSQRSAVSNDPTPAQPSAAPTPSPAPELLPSAAAADEEPEDETPGINTAPSLAAVQSVLASFATLQSGFTFPSQVDFLPSSSTSAPKLAYTSNNAPLHGYEHALTGLLTQLDAVESFGDDEVRRTRKEAVKVIERELEELDARKSEAWRRHFEPEVPASQATKSVEADSAVTVYPLTVPLPDDLNVEDRDEMGEAVPEAFPSPEHSNAAVSTVPPESPLLAPETFSTPAQSPVVEDLPPLPGSPVLVASPIALELPTLTPIAIPSGTSAEPLSQSLGSPSEASNAESDMDLEDYVDVDHMLASEDEVEQEEAELGEVEKDGDLELIRDWDMSL